MTRKLTWDFFRSLLDELAAKSGIPHRTLRISTDVMVSLGLLGCKQGRYRACR